MRRMLRINRYRCELTTMAVADGEVAPQGTLSNAKYLTAMIQTCENVWRDVQEVKCLPRCDPQHSLTHISRSLTV